MVKISETFRRDPGRAPCGAYHVVKRTFALTEDKTMKVRCCCGGDAQEDVAPSLATRLYGAHGQQVKQLYAPHHMQHC